MMDGWEISWADMCRTCMEGDDDLQPLYNDDENEIGEEEIAYKLMQVSSVKITKDDGLPSKICDKCAYRTSAFYDFKLLIQESDMKLKQIYYEHLNPDYKDNLKEEEINIPQEFQMPQDCISVKEEPNYSLDNSDKISTSILEAVNENGVETTVVEDFENICNTVTLNLIDENLIGPPINDGNAEHMRLVFHSDEMNVIEGINQCQMEENQNNQAIQEINISCLDIANSKNINDNSKNFLKANNKSIEEQVIGITQSILSQPSSCNDNKDNIDTVIVLDDDSDSDNYVDTRENIVGSINDTITKIKEIKQGGKIVQYQCTLCLQNYPELSEVLAHIVDLHVPIAGPYYCIVCEMDCDSIKHLKTHVKTHKGPNPYICFLCKKAYVMKRYLKRHMACHTDFPRHRCTKCGKRFKVKTELEDHITIYHGEEATSFKCSQCTRVFHHKGNYKRHLIIHLDPKGLKLPKYPCDICGKRFLNNRAMIIHRRTHTGEKPFVCEICNRAFTQQGNLISHKKIHINPGSFKCNDCGKCFNQKATLKDHTLIHSGEKPFVCTVCGYAFTFSAALRRHMWSHSEGKPYECDFCKARFVGRYDLRRHMTIHTGRPKHKRYRVNKLKKNNDVINEEVENITEDPLNTDTIFVEQIFLCNEPIQIVSQGDSGKENVDSLLKYIQYETN